MINGLTGLEVSFLALLAFNAIMVVAVLLLALVPTRPTSTPLDVLEPAKVGDDGSD